MGHSSTHHTVLNSTPGAVIFGRDMLFDIPYIADWTKIGQRRKLLVEQHIARENASRIDLIMMLVIKYYSGKMEFSAKLKTRMLALMLSHKCIQTSQ